MMVSFKAKLRSSLLYKLEDCWGDGNTSFLALAVSYQLIAVTLQNSGSTARKCEVPMSTLVPQLAKLLNMENYAQSWSFSFWMGSPRLEHFFALFCKVTAISCTNNVSPTPRIIQSQRSEWYYGQLHDAYPLLLRFQYRLFLTSRYWTSPFWPHTTMKTLWRRKSQ